jgi:hypothetical protein
VLEPNSTAVPAGELRVSVVERRAVPLRRDFSTGKTDKKPVLFTVGSPFTVVNSAVSSAEKKAWETVLVGPTGGVDCPISKGRRASIWPSPFSGQKLAQDIPATAPVVPTQTSLFFADAATVLGNSPGMETGLPRTVRQVGSSFDMAIMVRVLEPALTAKRLW